MLNGSNFSTVYKLFILMSCTLLILQGKIITFIGVTWQVFSRRSSHFLAYICTILLQIYFISRHNYVILLFLFADYGI